MMSIWELIQSGYEQSQLIRVGNSLEKFSCSLGCHLLNRLNNSVKNFYHASKLANFREHIVFQAPSGFCKSVLLDFFLHPETGILSEAPFPTDVEATFSPESWMGTVITGSNGDPDIGPVISEGVFERYKNGILGADEYTALKDMMSEPGARNDVVYLLKALDDGRANKNLATDRISISDICMTFWCGMRPTRLVFTSGLGRRFTYLVYFPTFRETQEFKRANTGSTLNTRILHDTKMSLKREMVDFIECAKDCDSMDYSEIDEWLLSEEALWIPHPEMAHYRRMAIGWSIINGWFPDVKLDEKLKELFVDEYSSREIIKNNPLRECVMTVLSDEENGMDEQFFRKFMKSYYQLPNAEVGSAINALRNDGKLTRTNGTLKVTADDTDVYGGRQDSLEDIIRIGGVI